MEHKLRASPNLGEHRRLIVLIWVAVALVGSFDLAASSRGGGRGRSLPSTIESSTPEQQGMDSELLAEAVEYFLDHRDDYNIHSMTVARDGVIVADGTFYPYQPGELHDIASVTKAITSTLIGIAIEQGLIESVDERMVDFFTGRTIANMSAMKRRVTLEHLLTMSSGFEWVAGGEWEASDDWVQYVLDRPMAYEPGTHWEYIGGNTHLLSAIITEVSGMTAYAFARQYLFEPLGIRESRWRTDPSGEVTQGDGRLALLPADMVKIGRLMLQDGVWEGRRILPEGWMDAATTGGSIDVGWGYGMHFGELGRWWFYGMHGSWGQRFLVCPENGVVLYLSGGGGISNEIDTLYYHATETWILPSYRSYVPLPEDPDALALLEGAFEVARTSTDEPYTPEPLPPAAGQVSGRTFLIDENAYGIEAVTFVFESDSEMTVRVATDGLAFEDPFFEWPAGLDGRRVFGRGRHRFLSANVGRWQNQQTVTVHVDEVGYMEHWQLEIVLDGDEVTIIAQGVTPGSSEDPVTFYGVLDD